MMRGFQLNATSRPRAGFNPLFTTTMDAILTI